MSETEAPGTATDVAEPAEPPRRETRAERLVAPLEALLFSSPKPVRERDLAELLEAAPKAVADALALLAARHEGDERGVRVEKVAGGWRFVTRPEFDALLCGYDPKARGRFVAEADNTVLWHRDNGLMLAPVLVRLVPFPVDLIVSPRAILNGLVEEEQSVDEIVARGFAREIVVRVQHLLYMAEYKRRQAPPGVKITSKSFGRDRRYPITNGFRERNS